jgi:uncharacterized membrane protein
MTKPLHHRIWTSLRHRWADGAGARRVLPAEAMERLRQRVAASEQRHTGQIRICVESSLPRSYLWRHVRRRVPMGTLAHQRALMAFSKLRVWDTECNNGVLIYLLVAEHAIDLIADRGVAHLVEPSIWDAMVKNLGEALRQESFEEGLTRALEEVSAVLVKHFPRNPDPAHPGNHDNELPDTPVVR